MSIDANLTTILLALIALVGGSIITPIITYILKAKQDRSIANAAAAAAEKVATKVEEAKATVNDHAIKADQKLDTIHHLVDGRLSAALSTIAELKSIILTIGHPGVTIPAAVTEIPALPPALQPSVPGLPPPASDKIIGVIIEPPTK